MEQSYNAMKICSDLFDLWSVEKCHVFSVFCSGEQVRTLMTEVCSEHTAAHFASWSHSALQLQPRQINYFCIHHSSRTVINIHRMYCHHFDRVFIYKLFIENLLTQPIIMFFLYSWHPNSFLYFLPTVSLAVSFSQSIIMFLILNTYIVQVPDESIM